MVPEIAKILNQVNQINNWSINLVKMNVSKKQGVIYSAEELSDFDENGISRTVKEIVEMYSSGEKSNMYNDIQEYDGNIISNNIYKIGISSVLIKDAYDLFVNALSDPDKESDPMKNKYDCYVLKSSLENNEEDIPIKLIFMSNPIKTLKNKFFKIHEKYTEITGKVIALSLNIDMIVYGDKIYFFDNSGEKLFNMERAYRAICREKVEEVKENEIVSDIETFTNVASSGHNPRKFVSFNKENLELLKNKERRRDISEKFNIPLLDGKFDTSSDGVSEKLIKLLCGKGKIDPFNNKPVEVSGAKEWR